MDSFHEKVETAQVDSRKENLNRPIGKVVEEHQWF